MNLNTSIDFLKDRVDKTRSVQETIADTWIWPGRTLAEWDADSGALDRSIEKEGTTLLSAWKLEFGGAAFVPGPGLDYESFRQLFHGYPGDPAATPPVPARPTLCDLKEAYSDLSTIDRRETGRLNAKLMTVERDCQHWYAEATRLFVAGTEIGDLIRSQVPTTTDYAGPPPEEEEPEPEQPIAPTE